MKQTTINDVSGIPTYGIRAYALFFSRHGDREEFAQNDLDWIVGQSMKKKIFSLLLRSGWIIKKSKNTYICISPADVFRKMLEFKVPQIVQKSEREYVFTGLSAVEIWSDYAYVQRGIEKSPYFIKIFRKDLQYWKDFFNKYKIPNYLNSGATIGEFVVLIPIDKMDSTIKNDLKVETLKETIKIAKESSFYLYAYNYIKEKYHGRITA